jgi:hypothetical protein
MVASEVTFERQTPHGVAFRMVVPGFRCPVCGEEVITGEQAERVSSEWQRLLTVRTASNDQSAVRLVPSESSAAAPGSDEDNATAARPFVSVSPAA